SASSAKLYTYRRHTFSRSYGVSLLSSLATVLSSALVFSTRPPESVCGTVTETTHDEDFLGSMGSTTSPDPRIGLVITSRRWMVRRICLPDPPTGLNRHVQQPDGLPFFVSPSLQTLPRWCRNINLLSIAYAFRPRLRHRLTLSRLPLPRKPETYGEWVSHPFYRYSCLHNRFQGLQQSLPVCLHRRLECSPTASVPKNRSPRLRHRA